MVIWDGNDNLMEAEKQLSDDNVWKEVNFNEKLIQDLTETSSKMFRGLKNGGFIIDRELKYFSFDHKIIKEHVMYRFFNVFGRPMISTCKTMTEKASEFLDFLDLKTIIQECWSYIKDSGDFINKISLIGDIRKNAILVTADA